MGCFINLACLYCLLVLMVTSVFLPYQSAHSEPPYRSIQSPTRRFILNEHVHGETCLEGICAEDNARQRKTMVKGILGAAGLYGAGLLLHLLPPRPPGDGLKTILPADWKVWARIILGIGVVQKINKAADWKPPAWLGALESVAIVTPLAAGFSKNSLLSTAIMAPIVMLVVQGTSLLTKKVSKPAEDKWQMPPVMTRLGLSLGLGVASILAYPKIFQSIVKMLASKNMGGQTVKDLALNSESAFASATFATCARGCSPGSFICLSEMADIVGSYTTWFNSSKRKQHTVSEPNSKPIASPFSTPVSTPATRNPSL